MSLAVVRDVPALLRGAYGKCQQQLRCAAEIASLVFAAELIGSWFHQVIKRFSAQTGMGEEHKLK